MSRCGLKAQQFHSPGQAKRRPGLGASKCSYALKGQKYRADYTFALTGRAYRSHAKPRAPLRLPWAKYFWAFSPPLGYGIVGLSARTLSCNGPMGIIKFKTTHTTSTTFYNFSPTPTGRQHRQLSVGPSAQ